MVEFVFDYHHGNDAHVQTVDNEDHDQDMLEALRS